MAGIEQTEDVIQAAGAVGLFLVQASADGWGFDDLRRALGDENLRAKVVEGVRGAEQIPGEIADADLGEVMNLALAAINEFKGIA